MNFEIDRKGVIDVLIKVRDEYKASCLYNEHLESYYKYLCEVRLAALDYAIKELKKQIIVQPEQKTGIWIDCPFNNLMDKRMMCGQCGSVETNLNHTNYCPNCGADMRGGESNG